MKKVAIYVRESNHSNAENAALMQNEKIKKFCEQKGYEVCDSVTAIGSRETGNPMLMKMIKSAKEKGIETVVMASTNRVVGTVEELKEIKEVFDDSGVAIETLDGSHITPPTLIESFLAAMSEAEDEE